MPSHTIRLIGPWQVQWLEPPLVDASFVELGSARMPCDWQRLFGAIAGRARFLRTFHCPTNLDDGERVVLDFTGVRGWGSVTLNGVALGEIGEATQTMQFDITAALQPSNRLAVELGFDPSATVELGGLFDVVRLVISSD